ncbi:MAG: GNAT family N-acetyltransferase [Thermomonas sp.]
MTGIRHDPLRQRFETEVDGHLAFLEYRSDGTVLAITHTIVPEAIGGRGIAGTLVRTAVEYARDAGLKVAPVCSYSSAWMDRHPEYAGLRV